MPAGAAAGARVEVEGRWEIEGGGRATRGAEGEAEAEVGEVSGEGTKVEEPLWTEGSVDIGCKPSVRWPTWSAPGAAACGTPGVVRLIILS